MQFTSFPNVWKNAHANHLVAWKPAELTDLPLNMRVITDLHELVEDPNGFSSQFGKRQFV